MQLRVQLGEHRVVDLDVQWMRIQPDPPVDCVDPLALCHWERKGERREGRESVLLVRGRIFLEFLIKKNTFRIFGRQWLIKVYVLPWHGTLRVFGDLHSGGSCGWIHLCGSKFSLWIFCRVEKKKKTMWEETTKKIETRRLQTIPPHKRATTNNGQRRYKEHTQYTRNSSYYWPDLNALCGVIDRTGLGGFSGCVGVHRLCLKWTSFWRFTKAMWLLVVWWV